MKPRFLLLSMLCVAPGFANAADFPILKPGLWEMRVTPSNPGPGAMQPHTTKMCIDPQAQKDMLQMGMGMMKSNCARHDMRMEGSKLLQSSECKFGNSTMKSESVITFNGDSSGYHQEGKVTYDPPLMGKSQSSSTMDAKWLGPCGDAMKPGDIMLPDGRTVNMRAMTGAMGGAMGAPK